MIENINWYPGHMKKTRELIAENLKMVDLVVEVIDARVPVSSRNPIIDELVAGKPRIIALNKMDLADGAENRRWKEVLGRDAEASVLLDSNKGGGVSELLSTLVRIQDRLNAEKTRKRPLRLMIVGIPNVGKSSLINRLTGKKSAKTGNKPGVTRGKQWLTLSNGMMLLDTPGILWPKFEDPQVGLKLAFCGSIKDEILDQDSLALELIRYLGNEYPSLLEARYKLDEVDEEALVNMEAIAAKRGFLLPGKRIDYSRCARTVLDEFRAGTIGRITLEKAPAPEAAE